MDRTDESREALARAPPREKKKKLRTTINKNRRKGGMQTAGTAILLALLPGKPAFFE